VALNMDWCCQFDRGQWTRTSRVQRVWNET